MASGKKVGVGVVGLGFGTEFVPLYQKHPDAECEAICQRDEAKLKQVGETFKVTKRYTRYEDLLKDKDIDAIHIVTPIAVHASMTVAALEASMRAAPYPWRPRWFTSSPCPRVRHGHPGRSRILRGRKEDCQLDHGVNLFP